MLKKTNPVPTHVNTMNFLPLTASTPTLFPFSLTTSPPFSITAVTSALASASAKNARIPTSRFTHADSRPEANTAATAPTNATKSSAMAMQYSTKAVTLTMRSASRPVWMSSGQSRSCSVTSTPDLFSAASRIAVGLKEKPALEGEHPVTFFLMSDWEMVALGVSRGVYCP